MSDEKIDISRALKSAITTGKVEFGVDQTTRQSRTERRRWSSFPGTAPAQSCAGTSA